MNYTPMKTRLLIATFVVGAASLQAEPSLTENPRQFKAETATDGMEHFFGIPPKADSRDIVFLRAGKDAVEAFLTDKTATLRAAAILTDGTAKLITNEKAAGQFKAELSLFASEAADQLLPTADGKQAAKTFEGTLQTGIVAVGGETTGIVLKTKAHGQYELDLKKDDKLLKLADKLNGKKVVVEGDYKPRPGVEVKERRIILVKSIKEAP